MDETVSVTQNFVNGENLDAVVHTLLTSDMRQTIEYWRARLLPLRPELFKYIGDRVAYESSLLNQERVAELEQQLEEQQEAFDEREKSLNDEIAQLRAQLAALNPPEAETDASSSIAPRTSTTAYLAQLVADQKKKKRTVRHGGY